MLAHPGKPWVVNIDLGAASGYGTKMSPHNHGIPLPESQHHVINPTNSGGALDNRVKHRLHVRGRAADDAEHFGCRRLMLQGLPQFRVACFEFLEQPDVLNRDHRLVRKGGNQFNLPICERPNFAASNQNYAYQATLPQHWNSESRTAFS